ncbi:hypothetical protein [Archangium sp.]|uniref:hypothetical protein n=1 Tax=Archangium sp. TaxID=1872627 RepID=UPI00286AFE28|nr:hypothetical protein [Archangium sp.]
MSKCIIRCGLVVALVLAGCGGEEPVEGVEEEWRAEEPAEPDDPLTAQHVPVTQSDPSVIYPLDWDTTHTSFVNPNIGRRRPRIAGSRKLRRAPQSRRDQRTVQLNDLRLDTRLEGHQFIGLGRGFKSPPGRRTFRADYTDPAPSGDVGPHHYVQVVNDSLAVFDKRGTVLVGPVFAQRLWFGIDHCGDADLSDGVVRFDRLAGDGPERGRWIITYRGVVPARKQDEPRMALGAMERVSTAAQSSSPGALHLPSADKYYQCVAVSATNDPTGSYHRYVFEFDAFNDAPKLGVWSDAYYLTASMSRIVTVDGQEELQPRRARICAMDRQSMVKGAMARMLCFDVESHAKHFADLLPADLDGEMEPPEGSSHYVFSLRQTQAGGRQFYNRIAVWKFDVDWTQTSASTLSGPYEIRVDPFEQAFTVLQKESTPTSSSPRLDPLGYKLTGRAPYRNFGTHQAILLTHSIPTSFSRTDARSSGLRWYELRLKPAPSGGFLPYEHQSGTYAPDGGFRWMGSIAFDKEGGIALGYSFARPIRTGSKEVRLPSLRYTGRTQNCPDGTMARERSLKRGFAPQVASIWATTSSLTIDPVDDCTFWYTGQYMRSGASEATDWSTHIGAFQLPGCLSAPPECKQRNP